MTRRAPVGPDARSGGDLLLVDGPQSGAVGERVSGGAVEQDGVGELEDAFLHEALVGDAPGHRIEDHHQGFDTHSLRLLAVGGIEGHREVTAVRARVAADEARMLARIGPPGRAVGRIEADDAVAAQDDRPGSTGHHLRHVVDVLRPGRRRGEGPGQCRKRRGVDARSGRRRDPARDQVWDRGRCPEGERRNNDENDRAEDGAPRGSGQPNPPQASQPRPQVLLLRRREIGGPGGTNQEIGSRQQAQAQRPHRQREQLVDADRGAAQLGVPQAQKDDGEAAREHQEAQRLEENRLPDERSR